MSEAQVHHGVFTIERELKAAPQRVYDAFADVGVKSQWFGADLGQYEITERSFDLRPGGKERLAAQWKNGRTSDFQCTYYDIIPGRRLVYVYEMFSNDVKLSVSLASIEFQPSGSGTRLVITEQGAYFGEAGAQDAVNREHGTNFIINGLVDYLGG